jgi:hypothetical protein
MVKSRRGSAACPCWQGFPDKTPSLFPFPRRIRTSALRESYCAQSDLPSLFRYLAAEPKPYGATKPRRRSRLQQGFARCRRSFLSTNKEHAFDPNTCSELSTSSQLRLAAQLWMHFEAAAESPWKLPQPPYSRAYTVTVLHLADTYRIGSAHVALAVYMS